MEKPQKEWKSIIRLPSRDLISLPATATTIAKAPPDRNRNGLALFENHLAG